MTDYIILKNRTDDQIIQHYPDRKRFVIVTTPGGGTGFMTRFFQEHGWDVQKENMTGEHGGVGHNLLDLRFRWYYDQHPEEFGPFLHQIREPMATISSLVALNSAPDFPAMRSKATGLSFTHRKEDSLFQARARYYIEWHQEMSKLCEFSYVLESFGLGGFTFQTVNSFIEGHPLHSAVLGRLRHDIGTHKHVKGYRRFTWADLKNEDLELFEEIREFAQNLGYRGGDL